MSASTPLPQRITQIALVVRNIDTAVKRWSRVLGVSVSRQFETEGQEKTQARYRGGPMQSGAKLAFFELENIQIELIEPIGSDNVWAECLRTRGEGVHHIAFKVPNTEETSTELATQGMRTTQKGNFVGGR